MRDDVDTRVRLAEGLETPRRTLARLARDPSPKVRWKVAQNPRTPTDTLLALVEDVNVYVVLRVAENLHTPDSALEDLSKHPDHRVREAVLRHPRVTPELLERLTDDSDERTRSRAWTHPKLSLERLTEGASSLNAVVRFCVSINPSSPPEVLDLLCTDPEREILSAVYNHFHATPNIRAKAMLCLTLEHEF